MIDFGAKLRAVRALKGMTQDELAQQIGVDRRDIIKFEQGISLPAEQVCQRLNHALGIKFDAPEVERAFLVLSGKAELAMAA